MTNKKIVENFIENHNKKLKRFILIQFIIDIIEVAAIVSIMLKVIDNLNSTIILIVAAIIVMMMAAIINIILNFGSLKKFAVNGNIKGQYDNAKTELEKVKKSFDNGKTDRVQYLDAQKDFEAVIDTLAEKIKISLTC